ncbi:MAG: hypothetical protein RL071_627 [Pseudomonadota bacterium]
MDRRPGGTVSEPLPRPPSPPAASSAAATPPQTIGEVLQKTQRFFADRGLDSPRADALLLIGHALGLERMQLLLQHDRPLTEAELGAVREGVRRRARREPTHLIIGERGFFTVDLKVVPGVLLPRSDTERLVEAALQWLPKDAPAFVADIGCGSGAIGLTLAHERPQLRVYCVDLAAEALACTKDNVARLGLAERVAVLRGDLLTPIPAERPIDVVVSNPPYIPTADIAGLDPEVRDFEPHLALDGGADGLAVYRRLLPLAAARAREAVLVEIGWDQGPAVCALAAEAGLQGVELLKDYGGRDRVVRGWVRGARWRPAPPAAPDELPTARAPAGEPEAVGADAAAGALTVEMFHAEQDPEMDALPVFNRD